MKILVTTLMTLMTLLAAGNVASQATQNIKYNTANSLVAAGSDGNPFPWCGGSGGRSQFMVPMTALTQSAVPVVIKDIFCQTHLVDVNHVNTDIEIRMGMTTRAYGDLSNNWDDNLPLSAATIVYRGPLNYNLKMNTWKAIGLPNAYTYFPLNGENLVIDVIIHDSPNDRYGQLGGCMKQSAYLHAENADLSQPPATHAHKIIMDCDWIASQSTTAPWYRTIAPSLGFLLGNGNFVAHGLGGITSPPLKRLEIFADTWPQPTKPMTISLSGAANVPSIIAFGFAFNPFDMATIGAPRSTIWFNPLIQVGMTTNSSGIADLPFVVPAGLTAGTLFAQWYQIDPGAYANQLGLTTSNCATLIFGN